MLHLLLAHCAHLQCFHERFLHIFDGRCQDTFHSLLYFLGLLHLFGNRIDQPGHKILLDRQLFRVGEQPTVFELFQNALWKSAKVAARHTSGHDLAGDLVLLLLLGSLLLSPSVGLFLPACLDSFHALYLQQLCVACLLELLLVPTNGSQLLFLKDLHHGLLQSLPHQNFQDRFDFSVEVEQLAFLDLRRSVLSDFSWHEQWGMRSIQQEIRLRLSLELHSPLRQFLKIRIRLDIYVLATHHWFRSANPFLCSIRAGQSLTLRFPLLFELSRIGLLRHDQRSISVASDNTLVIHQIGAVLLVILVGPILWSTAHRSGLG
mmetsp:Transcript_31635/g.75887  ORF Transcript_31635/g.75887 Transcript_31635/m.75887 type:complete len:319 (-) Transcript_31635:76-1032(-)